MKIPSQKLFHLVKNLTPSEKRYVRIFFSKSQVSDNKYILLFNAIDAQNELNEADLQEKVYVSVEVESKKFTELKSYLYQTILRILQDFDKETSVEYRFQTMLANVSVLYRRAFYEDCKAQIAKTRKLADRYEAFETLLELLRWEKQIAYAQGDINFLQKKLMILVEQEQDLLKKINNFIFYKNTFYEVYSTIRSQGLLKKGNENNTLLEKMKDEKLQSDTLALSQKAKIFYYRSRSIFAYYTRDNEEFFSQSKILIGLMEANPAYLEEEIPEYISVLSNFTVSCFSTYKYDDAIKNIEKLRLISPKTQDDKLKIHRLYYQSKFQWCINTASFHIGLEVMKEYEKDRQNFENQENINSSFHYAYFYISFGAGQFAMAQDYLNEWLGSSKTADRQDLQVMARLLSLILHYEMDNTYLLDSLLRTTTYYLTKHSALAAFEKLLIRFIREAIQSSSKSELMKIFVEIRQELVALTQDDTQSAFTQYFDFITWIESKISGESFAILLKNKLKER
jgi:hypothetical protein